MSLAERLVEDKGAVSLKSIIKSIEKEASKVAGTKLHVKKAEKDDYAKGMNFFFKEGGMLKIRPKSGGATLAKLTDQPKKGDYFLGVGKDGPSALAAMKPHKKGSTKKPKAKAKPVYKPKKTTNKAKIPGPKKDRVNGILLINDVGVDKDTWDRYATAAKDSADLLKKRGFGFILKTVRMYLRHGKPGIYGNYNMSKKIIEIFVNNMGYDVNPKDAMFTMVHELGHHYYYKEMPWSEHKKYKWYFKQAQKPTKKGQKSGDFPTAYAKTARYEDFAEIFTAYIGKGHSLSGKFTKHKYRLTRDSLDRLKSFLAFDKRINLKAEDENELTANLAAIEEMAPVTLGDEMDEDEDEDLQKEEWEGLVHIDEDDVAEFDEDEDEDEWTEVVLRAHPEPAGISDMSIEDIVQEFTDMPTKHGGMVSPSTRTGLGSAPQVDLRPEKEKKADAKGSKTKRAPAR